MNAADDQFNRIKLGSPFERAVDSFVVVLILRVRARNPGFRCAH